MVFYYIPWFGSAAYYGQDPYKFFFECREKVRNDHMDSSSLRPTGQYQYETLTTGLHVLESRVFSFKYRVQS